MSLTYGSVCSGIEAATAAWHPLGMRPAWFCEIEPFPSAVLAHHHPGTPNYGDFTRLLSPDHPRANVDVLVGGTPCQAFSVAGLRGGLADPRGNLALAFVALVGALRPRWVVWENVPGVLSVDGGRAFGSFLGGLAELGYGWSYRVLDAQYFGLAQRRKRVFVVASPGDWRRSAAVLFEPESVRRDLAPRRETGARVAVGAGSGAAGGCRRDDGQGVSSERGGVAAFGGGNTAGPLDVATACNAGGAKRMDFDSETFVAHTLRGTGHDASEDGTGRGVPLVPVAGGFYATSGSRPTGWVAESSPTLKCGGQLPEREMGATTRQGVRRLMPHELERLQGFPDHFTRIPYRGKPADDCPDGPRAKALGNSMAVPVMRQIGRRIQIVDGLA